MQQNGPQARYEGRGDRLLDALERLRAAERRMREAPETSEEFRIRAHDLEVQAREVFRLAQFGELTESEGNGQGPDADGTEEVRDLLR